MDKYMIEYINESKIRVLFVQASGVVSAYNTAAGIIGDNIKNQYDISCVSDLEKEKIKDYIKQLALYNKKVAAGAL